MDAATYARGLREFADWVEANEELIEWELERADADPPFRFSLYATSRENFVSYVRAVGRATKSVDSNYFHVSRTFGPVVLNVFTARAQVCERVVTGTREVTKMVRDPEQLEQAVEQVPLVEVTETVEDVEWVCAPSVLALVDEEEAVA